MSSYTTSLTLPVNGTISSQTSTELKLHRGVIHKIDILFPSGCNGLANVALYIGGHPIAPSTEGQFFTGNGYPIEFNEYIDLEKEVNVLTLSGYNLDDTYPHVITVRIFVLPKEVLIPSFSRQLLFLAIQELMLKSTEPIEEVTQVGF